MEKELIKELYDSIILEHSRHPRNFGKINNALQQKGKNSSCGDEIEIFLTLNNDEIEKISFEGSGCAICMSSCSLMTKFASNYNINEMQELIDNFIKFITQDNFILPDKYEPLHIYETIHHFPARVKCVLLPWRTIEHLLKYKQEMTPINTEQL